MAAVDLNNECDEKKRIQVLPTQNHYSGAFKLQYIIQNLLSFLEIDFRWLTTIFTKFFLKHSCLYSDWSFPLNLHVYDRTGGFAF